MKIVLCGYMGSGKTTVAKLMANKLQAEFVDLDQAISDNEKTDIPEIFKQKGEIYFRKSEKKALNEVLLNPENRVVSLGGGTPCYGNNLELIKNSGAVLVYLKMSVQTLTERLFDQKDARPMIMHYSEKKELEDFVRKHMFERGYYYLQSDIIIDADHKSPESIALEIMSALRDCS